MGKVEVARKVNSLSPRPPTSGPTEAAKHKDGKSGDVPVFLLFFFLLLKIFTSFFIIAVPKIVAAR